MSEVLTRPFDRRDREAVRSIAFATGFMGESVEWLWRDRDSFADLITNYYIEREPECLVVAERDAMVVGYLMGCIDSQRCGESIAREVRRLVRRGYLFMPGVAPFLWRSAFDILRARGAPPEILGDPRWPAHLHINLLPEGRGIGLGRRLMDSWLGLLRSRDVRGVHLGTFVENSSAIRFFQSSGFVRHGTPILSPGFRTRESERMHIQWMTQSLAG